MLIELLHRWEDAERVSAPKHKGEQVDLWNGSARLERELQEPFDVSTATSWQQQRDRLTPPTNDRSSAACSIDPGPCADVPQAEPATATLHIRGGLTV